MIGGPSDRIRVLHVDDEPEFADLAATFLERENDRFTVETATSADQGLRIVTDDPPDCIVSDYNMPGMDGLELLEAVREEYPDLPFLLVTGKGSEDVASDAISAGVTDYFQKRGGTEQYELLANRIHNAVQARRGTQRAERQEQLTRLTEFVGDTGGFELDRESETVLLTDGTRRIIGGPDESEISLAEAIELFHPDDREEIRRTLDEAFAAGEETHDTWRLQPETGEERLLEVTITPVVENGAVTKLRGAGHDVTEQKLHERNLKRYRTVFNELPDPVVVYDEGGRYRLVNDAAAEIRDTSREELTGTKSPYLEQIREAQPAAYDALVEGSRDTLRTELTDEFPGRGKRTLECDLCRVTAGTESDGTVIVTRDVTERKQRKTELEEYETIIEALTDAVYVLDEKGRFTYVNDEFVALVGYDRETVLGSAPSLIKDEAAVERAERELGRLLSSDGPESVTFEVTVQPRDCDPIVCEDHMGVLPYDGDEFDGSVGVLRDITDRKERKQQLQHERDRFRAVFEDAFDAMVIADDNGQYIEANERATELFGLPREELLGRSIRKFAPEEFDIETAWQEFQDSQRDRDTFPLARPDGTERTVEYAASTDVVPGQHLSVLRDVTDRKERQQQLDLLDRMLRHNLRNDVNVIRGAAEAILTRTTRTVAESARQIIDVSDQLIKTAEKERHMTELLQEPPDTEESTVGPLLEQVATGVGSDYPDATIAVECPDDVTVRVTKRFDRAIRELVTNAIVHSDSESPAVELSVVLEEEAVRIEVADSGPRIPEMERDVLLGNEEQTPLYHGSGLGLWLVRLTVSRSGGSIRFEQNSPTGNVVALELPE